VAHDEGLYARRARLVEESFNWFSSPFDSPHHKTIGSYWFIALSIRLFGNSELALRLPSIITSFFCLFSSYLIALKISNKKSALIAVFSLSSMPLWIQYSRYASPDIPFVLSILLTILFFLKFLDSNHFLNKYIYILISGFSISFAFFIRSYMALVPLIGLTPFLLYHLSRSKNIFKAVFSFGISLGFIPTILNLYFAYEKFGLNGITSLFDFAKNQAIGGIDFSHLIRIPFNYFYLTFPVGILLIILLFFTSSNNLINYPLLVYYYPIFSLIILLSMSTSYPHYYLFLLPFFSIIFAVKIQSFTFRFTFSKNNIKYILLLMITLIICTLTSLFLYYNDFIIEGFQRKIILIYLISLILVFSYIYSLRFVFNTMPTSFNLIKFFYTIIVPQYISLSLLYNFGILGNPNSITKSFINDKYISSIINSNIIYLYNVDSKIQTLLTFYLPSYKVVKSLNEISKYSYIITSYKTNINILNGENSFRSIKKFDKHSLLMNISK
tara:strand:- start:130 stop:1623 length:1494 start_codon:yes stop_codon:yes gene_type:complete